MDFRKIMFIIKNKINDDVIDYRYDEINKKIRIQYSGGKFYFYNENNVKILESPQLLEPETYRFTTLKGTVLFDINNVYRFFDGRSYFYRIFFSNGTFKNYYQEELSVSSNLLHTQSVNDLFNYYKQTAHNNSLKTEEGNVILDFAYDSIRFLDSKCVLSSYLNTKKVNIIEDRTEKIFPFGCNFSQIQAVRNAFTHNISVIEGPPGTGKTQTILNIIANIVMSGKTVMVVSNNNTATQNVYEKLKKYGYDFLAAQTGSTHNTNDFITHKQTEYPDFTQYPLFDDVNTIKNNISTLVRKLIELFQIQNRYHLLVKYLSDLRLEQKYYLDYFSATYKNKSVFRRERFTSYTLLNLWTKLQGTSDRGKKLGFFRRLFLKFKYKISVTDIFFHNTTYIIAYIKKMYYEHKIAETEQEINQLKNILYSQNINTLIQMLTSSSESLFKHSLKERYGSSQQRCKFDMNYWKDPHKFLQEYPVILSTTFSATRCLKNMIYDYVIVDEASQVDLTSGILAMSCAKNMVIVGDLKQLPNVLTSDDIAALRALSEQYYIPIPYRCEKQSLLSSVCEVFKDMPRTLLREHYRCHPKIIDFCNKKFYNNQLIIMTYDKGEQDVLKACITASGNHARKGYNQRQIDEIIQNILPELASSDVGIIAPYNAQTNALVRQINQQIPIYTVHKFQGRENNDIIITTVDNEITKFTDDPNLLNVAVSRAKNRLRIVISDNENNKNTNIGELIRYIEYNNFEVYKSDLYSIFDMLYKEYENVRKVYLQNRKKISEYDSENLMYALIEDVLKEDCFTKLDVLSHIPLNVIIRDMHLLNDAEVQYVMNPMTHLDFVIYNRIDKKLVLAIEVDGYAFHKKDTHQYKRDIMKNNILQKYSIPFIRFSTTGSSEKEKLIKVLNEVLK